MSKQAGQVDTRQLCDLIWKMGGTVRVIGEPVANDAALEFQLDPMWHDVLERRMGIRPPASGIWRMGAASVPG
jgi:hypothetical protein